MMQLKRLPIKVSNIKITKLKNYCISLAIIDTMKGVTASLEIWVLETFNTQD